MTIQEALTKATTALLEASDAPELDAAWLLLNITGQANSSWLISHSQDFLAPEKFSLIEAQIAERAAGKPLAYILGQWDFYGRSFLVNPDVLIPRPATEQLVRQALATVSKLSSKYGRRIVVADLGCGSGCIAITLALESNLIERIYAVDVSLAALNVARRNARRHEVSDRIVFQQQDILSHARPAGVDLIVSNPPYLTTSEISALPTRNNIGLQYEPVLALDGGADGQRYLKQIRSWRIPATLETTGGEIEVSNE